MDRQTDQGAMAAAISNAVVHTTREYTGRGPTKARTHISDEVITCVLADTLTKGERKLVDNGMGEHVRGVRQKFQDAMREELVASIEEITGRKVIGFMSDNHIDPDLASEVFVLEPEQTGSATSEG